jgi:hypothetical protein
MSFGIMGRQEAHGPARPCTDKVGPSMGKEEMSRTRPWTGRAGPWAMSMSNYYTLIFRIASIDRIRSD